MKAALFLSVLALSLAGPGLSKSEFLEVSNQDMRLEGLNFNQVMDIIGGFFVGMGADINATHVAPCVTNSDVFGGWIEQSVVDFSKHTFDGTAAGFMDLSNAFGALPGFIDQCVPAAEEVGVAVEKAVLAWAHPLSLLYHVGISILLNGQEIFADISKAMTDYQAGNWYGFGYDIGHAAFKIIYVPPKETMVPQQNEMQLIVTGMTSGFEGKTDLSACAELPDVGELIASGINGMKTKAFVSAKNGLSDWAEAIELLIPALEGCVSEQTVDRLRAAAEVFVEPYSFVFAHHGAVMINGRAIGKELKVAMVNFEMGDFTGFGRYLAKAIINLD